jgi:putative photosynthetic complex assembly protein 2
MALALDRRAVCAFHLVVFHRGDPARGPARGQGRAQAPWLWAVMWNLPVLILGGWASSTRCHQRQRRGGLRGLPLGAGALGLDRTGLPDRHHHRPEQPALPEDAPEWERFIRAWGTVAYHEMLLAFTLIAMIFASYGAENTFGSGPSPSFSRADQAKLNLYLGVRKINVEFIPEHAQSPAQPFPHRADELAVPDLDHRPQRRRRLWLGHVFAADTPAHAVGYALLGRADRARPSRALVHGAPLPDERLWRWMLPDRPTPTQAITTSEEAR